MEFILAVLIVAFGFIGIQLFIEFMNMPVNEEKERRRRQKKLEKLKAKNIEQDSVVIDIRNKINKDKRG